MRRSDHKKKKINLRKIGERSVSLLLAVIICLQIADLSVIESLAETIDEGIDLVSSETDTSEDEETDSEISGGTVIDDDTEISGDPVIMPGVIVQHEVTYVDLTVSSDYTMTSDMEVNNLELSGGTFDTAGYTLTVHGNLNAEGGNLFIDKGQVICCGDAVFSSQESKLQMDNVNDYLLINGNFIWKKGWSLVNSGVIEIKGDFIDESTEIDACFYSGIESIIKLSSDKHQNIVQSSPYSYVNTFEIENSSSEGVFANMPVNAGSIIGNGNGVNYPIPGKPGWKLQDDEETDDDLYLTGGELDLNGHTLTIHGNLIQAAGRVNINGGTLNIDGDYKFQSKVYDDEDNIVDSYSTGVLVMTNEDDTVNVSGDLIDRTADDAGYITNGKICIGGDFFSETTDKHYIWGPLEEDEVDSNNTVVFNGTKAQSITFEKNGFSSFANLELANTSAEGVTVKNVAVKKELKNTSCKVNGEIILGTAATVYNNECSNSIAITDPYGNKLSSDLTINGDLYVYVYGELHLNGHTLTVKGNTVIEGGIVKLEKGSFICEGNVTCLKPEREPEPEPQDQPLIVSDRASASSIEIVSDRTSSYIEMKNSSDYVLINGDFTFNCEGKPVITAGTLEVKGNVKFESSFDAVNNNSTHRFILSGTKKQTVTTGNSGVRFNILELKNKDSKVVVDGPFSYVELIRNGCTIEMDNSDEIFNKTLEEDETIDGDLCMGAGCIDLNGHTLTVKGNIYQSGGCLLVNGGTLNVEGDYRIQKRKVSEDGSVSFEPSNGCFVMTNEKDIVNINGSFYTWSEAGSGLTKGKMYIQGDFVQQSEDGDSSSKGNFSATDEHTVIFNGTKPQSITFADNEFNCKFGRLELANTSSEGITANGKVYVFTSLKNPSTVLNGTITFYGPNPEIVDNYCHNSIAFQSFYQLSDDCTIDGDVYVYSDFKLNGHTLTVKGDLSCGKTGKAIPCEEYVNDNRSYIVMQNDNDKVLVYGDYSYNNNYAFSYECTSGTLEIKGNVHLKQNFWGVNTHRVLLSGSKKQTITADSQNCHYNILELSNTSDEGVVIGENFNCEKLIKNDCNVKFANDSRFGWKLTDNETINGDLDLGAGELDLNGYTLTVKGDILQRGGVINIHGGTLNVKGDYRIQDKNGEEYTQSSGILKMADENDTVNIDGSLYVNPMIEMSYQMTAGTLCLKGDLVNTGVIFGGSNIHNFILNGTKEQKISGKKFSFRNLELANTSREGITIECDAVTVDGALKNPSTIVNGVIGIGAYSKISGGYCKNSILIDNSFSLKQDLTIDGDLYVNRRLDLNGYTLTVNGDTLVNGCVMILSKGQFIGKGNVTLKELYRNVTSFEMKESNEKVVVYGDFVFESNESTDLYVSYMSAGTMELKGDVTIKANFNPTGTHKVVLSGNKKQTVTFESPKSTFNILELQNHCKDGIFCTDILNSNKLITNNCMLTFKDNDRWGWTLSDDLVIDGDLKLTGGTLDLAGHKMTVTGSFIHKAGTVLINHGTLTVNNDYHMDIPGVNLEHYYTTGNGILKMTNNNDRVVVKGSFIAASDKSQYGNLTAGVLEVGGDLIQRYSTKANFDTIGSFTIKINGDKKQTIYFIDFRHESIANIVFDNSSDEGVEIINAVTVSNSVVDLSHNVKGCIRTKSIDIFSDYFYSGDVALLSEAVLDHDLDIGGTLTVNKDLDINGKSLNVGALTLYMGKLSVNDGKVNCFGDFTIDEDGELSMTNAKDSVIVGGDLLAASDRSHSGLLTNGVLELKGDFTQSGILGSFICSGEHVTVLSGKQGTNGNAYKQTISFERTRDSGFNKLILRKAVSEYIFDPSIEKICKEYSVEYIDNDPPSKVMGLSATEVGVASASLQWAPSTDNYEVVGYEIYRNGKKAAAVSDTSYTDTELSPDTTYTYKVRAFDKSRNMSEFSDKITVTTEKDTEPPEVPAAVRVKCRTGRSVTITWLPSSDNVKCTNYIVFRDDEQIAQTEEPEYKDCDVVFGTEYTYRVIALDASGNTSDYSDPVKTYSVLPHISSVSPSDNSEIGTGNTVITVKYPNDSTSQGNKVKFEYSADNKNWIPITSDLIGQQVYSSGELCSSCTWDTSKLESGEYSVRCTLYDADDCTDVKELRYFVDNEPPVPVTGVKTDTKNGAVTILWNKSSSSDCKSYKLYRAEGSGSFEMIKKTDNADTVVYIDKTAVSGQEYSYYVTAIDAYGHESEQSRVSTLTVSADEEKPYVTTILTPKRVNGTANIEISAYDNISVARIQLEYLDTESETWKDIKTADCVNNKATIKWDTTSLTDGEYKIRAFAWDTSDNKSEEEFTETFTVDNTGPSKIELADSTSTSNAVSIRWNDLTENDLSYFCVEQLIDGRFVSVGTEKSVLGMHVKGLKPDTEYQFRVVGYDNLGNRGIPSDILKISTAKDTTKPYIDKFGPAQSFFRTKIKLNITANDNCSVSALKLYFSNDNKETWKSAATLTADRKTTSYEFVYDFDGENFAEGDIFFKAVAVDEAGNESSPSIAVHRIDRTAPQQIDNLTAADESGYVSLNWTACDDDIEYYIISRANEENGIYVDIEKKWKAKNYYDSKVEYNTVYSYRIRAVDAAGNVSELSNESVIQVSKDTEAPKIYGVAPRSDSLLPQNPTIGVLARDAKLDTVSVLYRKKDSEEDWTELGTTTSIKGVYEKVDFVWNTEALTDGEYEFCAYALDTEGNKSESYTFEYKLDNTAPAIPELHLTKGDFQIKLDWNESDEEDIAYSVLYRKDSSQRDYVPIAAPEEYSYIDNDVEPGIIYTYKIEVYDKAGNKTVSNMIAGFAYDNDTVAPTAVVPDEITAVVGREVVLDGTQSSDNVRIQSFEWDMGNNDKVNGARAKYTYPTAGVYTAKLTVADAAGNTDEAVFKITVLDPQTSGTKTFRIFGNDNTVLRNAAVYMYDSDENKSLCADSDGYITVAGTFGEHKIAVYKDGYLPTECVFTIDSASDQSVGHITLEKGDVVVGQLTSHRMTLEEMQEAGIDFKDPENYESFVYVVELGFVEVPICTEIIINYNYQYGPGVSPYSGGGSFNVKKKDGCTSSVSVKAVDLRPYSSDIQEPVLCYMITDTGKISWLKDMYSVELGILNAAAPKFVLENCMANLTIPDGLSMAKTHSGQSETQSMGSIKGQESKSAYWYLKGDKNGSYDLTASFRGTLMPFAAPINVSFKSDAPIVINRDSGLTLYVCPESAAYNGEEYFIQYVLVNDSDKTLYGVKTTFGTYTEPERKEEITVINAETGESQTITGKHLSIESDGTVTSYSDMPPLTVGDSVCADVFAPHQSIKGTFRCSIHWDQKLKDEKQDSYFSLVGALVDIINGEDLGVTVKVVPIPSHILKRNVCIVSVPKTFGDPVDMTTGAFTDNISALSLKGDPELCFDMSYNSLHTEKGQCGYGWSHGYESKVVEEYGTAKVYLDPVNYISFITDDAANNIVYGKIKSIDDKNVTVELDDNYFSREMDYKCISTGMDKYKLHRSKGGSYELTFPDGSVWSYDREGRVTKMVEPNGTSADITYGASSMTVTDPGSGKYIAAEYNDSGLITSVYDSAGRKVFFTYDDDCLVCYTNAEGETIGYTYDENHRIVSESNANGVTFVANEYDEEGRVIAQDDALAETPLMTFDYSVDDEENTVTTSTDRNGNSVVFKSDRFGHITEKTDRNGNSVYYDYDDQGNLICETNKVGGKTTYSVDDNNNVVSITDCAGNAIQMSYDEAGNIVSTTGALGTVNSYTYSNSNQLTSVKEGGKPQRTYSYDENGMLVQETTEGLGSSKYTYENGLITSISDLKGQTTYQEYDACGNVIKETYPDGTCSYYTYDNLGRQTSIINSMGGVTSMTYDIYGNVVKTTDANGNVISSTYDANNNLISSTDALGNTTTYEYDNEGNPTKIIYPDGTCTINEYDGEGNVVKTIDANGSESSFVYDAANNLVLATQPNGSQTSYEYYPNGQQKKITYADGSYVTYSYDGLWRMTKSVDNLGNEYKYEYDNYNNVTKIIDPLDNVVKNEYDYYGRLVSSTDANGNVTSYEYDVNSNCTKKINPDNTVCLIDYDARNLPVKITIKSDSGDISVGYEYDALGRVTKYTDEEGNEFKTEYDNVGNVTAVIDAKGNYTQRTEYDGEFNVTKVTDALNEFTQYSYDSSGNVTSAATSDGRTSTYSYDALDRLINTVDAENGTSSQEYDSVGNVTAVIDPNGGKNTYAYDNMGRITESVNAVGCKNTYTYNAQGLLAEAKNGANKSTTYEYDALGRITSLTDDLGTISYKYDANGNVLEVKELSKETGKTSTITRKYDCMNRVTEYTDARGNTVKYGYDSLGNLVTLTYPGGEIVRYAYYPTGRLKTVTDWNNKTTNYEYDGNGKLTKTTRPDGSVETREYDAAGRLTKQTDINGDKVINSFTYDYDTAGNIISLDSETTAEDTVKLESASMEYDKANKLIKFNGEDVVYDACGNMTYGPLNGVMTTFTYDCRNRLISAGNTTYAYDAENNRISVKVGNTETKYVVENNSGELSKLLSSETDGKTTLYIYGTGLIAQNDEENGYLYYHFNNIGSTTAVTDGDGKLKYAFSYGTYGELLSGDTHGILFLYNGEYGVTTDANGLYYMRARYYNVDIKRFINQDVVEGTITNSPSLNKYAYCQGNPVSLLDPFGLSPFSWSDLGHLALDILSDVPGLGLAANIVNGIWYLKEGKTLDAISCFVGCVPIVGGFIGNSVKLGLKGTCLGRKIIHATKAVEAVWNFGTGLVDVYKKSDALMTKYFDNHQKVTWGTLWEVGGLGLSAFSTFSSGVDLGKNTVGFAASQCFVEGTPVLTDEGSKPIEEIKAGDHVYSTDPATGESEYKEVVQTFENESDELVHVTVDGDEITTTPKHPFYVPYKGWTDAIDLRAGDILVLSNGEYVVVEKVQHEILESPVKVYNFEVRDYHTYYVGENFVLVHNACDLRRSDPATYYTYGELRDEIDNAGLKGAFESHHLLEKQYASQFGINNADDIISVPLISRWHRGVGSKTINHCVNIDAKINRELKSITGQATNRAAKAVATAEDIWHAHRNVYHAIGQDDWAGAIYEAYVKKLGIAY